MSESQMARTYKDYKIYCCLALNRLVSEMGIDLYQPELESKLDQILASWPKGVSKEDIKHEIRSNHFMTNKVIEELERQGLVRVEIKDGQYEIRITKEGILYIRRYNEFFLKIYEEQIRDHYKYHGMPHWTRGAGK
jgi:predicted transcriptional regulator